MAGTDIEDFLLAHDHDEKAGNWPNRADMQWILWQQWTFGDWPFFLPSGEQLVSVKVVMCVMCAASEVEFLYG